MLKNVNWSLDRDYKTGGEDEPLQFYLDALCNSKKFDLLLGYFSSSALNVLSLGFANFIYSGGKMRAVINNVLSEKDKKAIQRGQDKEGFSTLYNFEDIKELKSSLDDYGRHFFECFAWLIANDRIELKIIKPKNRKGISHYKSGVFGDEHDFVSFKSSCNFTYFGFLENLEELDCRLSWEGNDLKKVQKQQNDFEQLFSGKSEIVDYLDIENVKVVIKEEFGDKNIQELVIQEKELIDRKKNSFKNPKIISSIKKAKDKLKEYIKVESLPKFPYENGPRKYQQIAFENWKNNTQQGLFAMATGTGKTITSLNCLLEVYKKTGYYKALILVPTITLINQWENECKSFNFLNIVKVSSKSKWKNDLSTILTREKLSPTEDVSFIVISTYASFARENIFNELNELSVKTLFIADECHNMGSSTLLKLLPRVNAKRRIGLSATPERQYDDEGNKKLFSFFNSANKYTYEYSMEEAINNKVLCRYYYYPHLVSLTENEMRDYMELSLKISKFYKKESESFNSNPILTALLLARKRIIHKAFNKVSVFSDILKGQFKKKGNLKYTLIYVPEGNDPNDYFETDLFSSIDETSTDCDAVHLIDVFTQTVKDIDKRTTIRQFISGTNEKELVLEQFANGEIDVLTSMKCLDEGVDVPRSELAIFCASTGNPRQFVQRRGRILRQHVDKQFAYIHDLVVIPELNANNDCYNMERNLVKKELERVKNFALLSENSSHTVKILLDTMNYYNLNLYNNE